MMALALGAVMAGRPERMRSLVDPGRARGVDRRARRPRRFGRPGRNNTNHSYLNAGKPPRRRPADIRRQRRGGAGGPNRRSAPRNPSRPDRKTPTAQVPRHERPLPRPPPQRHHTRQSGHLFIMNVALFSSECRATFNGITSPSAVIGLHLHRPTVIPKVAGVSVMLAERGLVRGKCPKRRCSYRESIQLPEPEDCRWRHLGPASDR